MKDRKFLSGDKVTIKGTKETGTVLGIARRTNSGYIEYSVRLENPDRFHTIPEKYLIKLEEAGNGTSTYPMPGELVRIINSKDCLIKEGSFGVIEGIVGQRRDEYLVCFNAYSTFKEDSVSSSGGPAYMIKTSDLVAAVGTKEWYFWKWKDLPRADGGVQFSETCRIWDFDLKKKKGAQ
ncbi:MAG: hypothetical protein OIN86_10195 [Candidatus Methanoperedens sp.]|nr:hypothetical protein [Candidatus Methanoperedens sp.]CAG0970895.1 hypothetical protein METP1_01235 [Methanosarcinales archaeon]